MITDFVRVLRAADIRVSPAETIEAAAILDTIGLDDRALLKTALGQGLAKTQDEKTAFNMCFDDYFSVPDNITTPSDAEKNLEEDFEAQDPAPQAQDLAALLESGNEAALQAALVQAANDAGLSEARLFTQQGIFTRRILEGMGLDALDARLRQLRAQNGNGDAGGGAAAALEAARAGLFEGVSDYVQQQIALRTKNAGRLLREDALSRIRLGNLDQSDMALMRALVRRLAKKIASRHARRRKKNLRGHLDIRRTMRKNQAYDGLLFNLAWRRVKRERPKLIVMCDVSGSVAALAQFFLMFLYNLGDVMPRTRSFVFSNQCGEISDLLKNNDIDSAMQQALRRFGGGSTDYGTALQGLSDVVLDDMDRHTTLLILGDGRSNYGDPGAACLRDMAARARRVIWLNPEARVSWNTGDSEMRRLGAYCTQTEVCQSLRQVERIIDGLLRITH